MCGIAGAVTLKSDHSLHSSVKQMTKAMEHRGPDGEGWHLEDRVVLAIRRLSIIDIEHGDQPFKTEDGQIHILFNGEIYNYVELQDQLKKKGYRFKSNCDGEVIPYLYQEHGIGFLKYLRGMFAIVIYNRRINKIYLIRDRMGEKPIYYLKSESEKTFFYASEMKAVMEVNRNKVSIDPLSVDLFLKYQFIPEPSTMFREVKKVPAGKYLELDTDTLEFLVHPYWSLPDSNVATGNTSVSIKEQLESIINIIGRSDVPIGIALSGGIDSGAIAALFASKERTRKLSHAFTVGYENTPQSDERMFAQKLALDLNIPLHTIEITAKEFSRDFPALINNMDDPIGDIAAYSIYRVMKAAKDNHIKVILNGIGADEIFWGYPWAAAATEETFKLINRGSNSHLYFYEHNVDFNYALTMSNKLYQKEFAESVCNSPEKEYYRLNGIQDIPVQMIDTLCKTWLYSDPVALGDRLSMANSVELRSPFLDYQLVELCIGINKKNNETYKKPAKSDLKKALDTYLPREILNRPKQGFTPPVRNWLMFIYKEYSHLLINGYLVENGFISASGLTRLLKIIKYWRGLRYTRLMYVYKLILLEIWLRQFTKAKEIYA